MWTTESTNYIKLFSNGLEDISQAFPEVMCPCCQGLKTYPPLIKHIFATSSDHLGFRLKPVISLY